MKTGDWIGNSISIALFALLALASWALTQYLERARPAPKSTQTTGPNAIIERPRIVRSDWQGRPQYRLEAERITMDESADETLLSRPTMISLTADKPRTTLRAAQAVTTEKQNRVDLSGDVVITRDAFAEQPPVRIETPRATMFIDEERAVTDAPVRVQRGLSTLEGVGMKFDQKSQSIDILSQSRMVLPKEKKQ